MRTRKGGKSEKAKAFLGITRVELLVTAGLTLLLGALMVLAVVDARRRSRDAAILSRVRSVQAGLEAYRGRTASYPTDLGELQAEEEEGFAYEPRPEGCRADGERLCTEYSLRFALEGALGSLPGGACVAERQAVTCTKAER